MPQASADTRHDDEARDTHRHTMTAGVMVNTDSMQQAGPTRISVLGSTENRS